MEHLSNQPAAAEPVARPNFPTDLESIAREVIAAQAQIKKIVDKWSKAETKLRREYNRAEKARREDCAVRTLPHKVAIGQLLAAARPQFQKADDFYAWAGDATGLARSTVKEWMKIAGAEDPEDAEQERREKATERKRSQRERERAAVTPLVTAEIRASGTADVLDMPPETEPPQDGKAARLPPLYEAWANTVRVVSRQLGRLLNAEASVALFLEEPKNAKIVRKLRDRVAELLPSDGEAEPVEPEATSDDDLDPDVHAWIATFYSWPLRKKELAYTAFLQHTGVHGLGEPAAAE
jgi:hypothetical protein